MHRASFCAVCDTYSSPLLLVAQLFLTWSVLLLLALSKPLLQDKPGVPPPWGSFCQFHGPSHPPRAPTTPLSPGLLHIVTHRPLKGGSCAPLTSLAAQEGKKIKWLQWYISTDEEINLYSMTWIYVVQIQNWILLTILTYNILLLDLLSLWEWLWGGQASLKSNPVNRRVKTRIHVSSWSSGIPQGHLTDIKRIFVGI